MLRFQVSLFARRVFWLQSLEAQLRPFPLKVWVELEPRAWQRVSCPNDVRYTYLITPYSILARLASFDPESPIAFGWRSIRIFSTYCSSDRSSHARW